MDGFEKNVGLIVLATTNHPDRVDPAIINRPSRFNRKYHFNLPNAGHLAMFLKSWQERVADRIAWSEKSVEDVANRTDGFSFAYLKELVVSSLMAAMAESSKSFEGHLREQSDFLALQMKTAIKDDASKTDKRRRRSNR